MLGFVVEKHEDGRLTVFISSSPAPMAGSIYVLPPERVHLVNVPLHKAMGCVTKWGSGVRELCIAMQNGSTAEEKGEAKPPELPLFSRTRERPAT